MCVCRFEFSVSMVELHRRTLDVAVKNGGSILSKHKGLLGKVILSNVCLLLIFCISRTSPMYSVDSKTLLLLTIAGAGRFKWGGYIERMDTVVNLNSTFALCITERFL